MNVRRLINSVMLLIPHGLFDHHGVAHEGQLDGKVR
jgi:hypothetical protein